MTIGDFIKEYRKQHSLSQRQFAALCGLSNGYISMLEKQENPKTKKPIAPTVPQWKCLAAGMGISLMELFEAVEDAPVDLLTDFSVVPKREAPISTEEDGRKAEFNSLFEELNAVEQDLIIAQIKGILSQR